MNPVRSLFLKEINYLIEAIKGASNGVNRGSKTDGNGESEIWRDFSPLSLFTPFSASILLLAGIIFKRGDF